MKPFNKYYKYQAKERIKTCRECRERFYASSPGALDNKYGDKKKYFVCEECINRKNRAYKSAHRKIFFEDRASEVL